VDGLTNAMNYTNGPSAVVYPSLDMLQVDRILQLLLV